MKRWWEVSLGAFLAGYVGGCLLWAISLWKVLAALVVLGGVLPVVIRGHT
jgi:hypothetical protein